MRESRLRDIAYICTTTIERINMKKPFVYGELATKDNFIDRQEDRKRLKTFLENGINIMLISPRRWGKSSLVKVAMDELRNEDKNIRTCFIDAFKIHSASDFYNAFASAVVSGVGNTLEKGIELVKKYIPSLTPSITLQNDPLNAVSLDLKFKPLERSAEDILNLPETLAKAHGFHVIVVLMSFSNWPCSPNGNRWKGSCGPSGNSRKT